MIENTELLPISNEQKNLTLSVKTLELGKIITNAKEIKDFVINIIKTYSVDDYQGDEKQARSDKAELNNAAKKLNDERIRLEREWNAPFTEFKDIVKETTDLLSSASSKIDVILKEEEARKKSEKKNQIIELWNNQKFELVTLEKIFNQKWLNRTYKISTVQEDINLIIEKIKKDLNALESFGDDCAILKELYLSNLNLQVTLQKGAELKANREKLKSAEKEVKTEIAETQKQPVKVESEAEEKKIEKTEVQNSTGERQYLFNVMSNKDVLKFLVDYSDRIGIELIDSITLKGTVKQIEEFKNILIQNGKSYEKQVLTSLVISEK